jgi:segregation and condensation protein A
VHNQTSHNPPPAQGPFAVRVELFDGPIDLLLHLVKRNELPIEKISLAQVSSQYFACVREISYFDFEVAGEYLVIASTLLAIKAAFLLDDPTEDIDTTVLQEDEAGDDPQEALLERLRQAEVYKRTAYDLSTRELLGVDVFEPPQPKREPSSTAPLKQHDPFLLGQAFRRILERAKASKLPFSLSVDHISITDRMMEIVNRLERSPEGISFEHLLGSSVDIGGIIVSFLAVLELAKRSVVVIEQQEAYGVITLKKSISAENQDDTEGEQRQNGLTAQPL